MFDRTARSLTRHGAWAPLVFLFVCLLIAPSAAAAAPLLSAHIAVSGPGAVHADSLSQFGLDYAATDGFDAGFDLFAPPTPPGDWIVAYFDRPAWGQIWDRFMADVRSPLTVGNDTKQWRLTVNTNVATDITVRLAQIDIPAGYTVRLLATDATVLVSDFKTTSFIYTTVGGPREFIVELKCTGCVTGIEPEPVRPDRFRLLQNYPNPFNAATNVRFVLAQSADINLSVYNLLGQPVAELADGVMSAGEHAVIWTAHDTPSGVYFIRLVMADQSTIVRAILLK